MSLLYYKSVFVNSFTQFFRKLKFRRGNFIGRKCIIAKDCIMEGENEINDYVIILSGVTLRKKSRLGLRAVAANIDIGENSFLECGVLCTGYGDGKIVIGRDTYIGINNILDFSCDIRIGNYVHIAGPSTGLWTHSSVNMPLKNIGLEDIGTSERFRSKIVIEDNVFIGGNCTIYPGVTIHSHSVVAPNSVVTKDVDAFTMVGGVPAKFIKSIEGEK